MEDTLKNKKRAMITVNAEQWDAIQQELKDRGYPANSMSFYLASCLNDLEDYLCGEYSSSGLPPVYELEIHNKGIKAAMRDIGLSVVQKEDPDQES